MTFGDADIQFLAQAASRIDADRIYQVDYAPGHVNQLGSMADMRDEVSNIFNTPEPRAHDKAQPVALPAALISLSRRQALGGSVRRAARDGW